MKKDWVERTPYTLSAEVFAVVVKRPCSVEDICMAIFKNLRENNQSRVWRCCNAMMKHGVLIPAFDTGKRVLLYKLNNGFNEKNGR